MVTNNIRRTKVKLRLLREENIGWLLKDVIDVILFDDLESFSVEDIIQRVKNKYALILSEVPGDNKQLKIEEL